MRKSLNISHSSTAAFTRALLLVTALSLAFNAGGQETAPAKINERAESGGVALTVVKSTRQAAIGQFQKADADNTFLVAEVVIETTGDDEVSYNPGFFRVKDSSGVEYNGTPASGATNSLKYGKLAKGEKVRGTVAFQIQKDAKGLVLTYKPPVTGDFKPIRVALEWTRPPPVDDAQLAALTPQQRTAVNNAQLSISARKVGAGAGAAIASGIYIFIIVMSFVGGLLGWLLIMRKRVLQCARCGAVVPAS